MASINEAQLKEQIKNNGFSNAYIIYGEESYLKDFYVGKLRKKLVDSAFADFNFHQREGQDCDMNDIMMDSSMLPMMSEYSLVLVHDYPFENASDINKLEEILKDLSESTVLIFWYDRLSFDVKKSKTYSKVIKLFSKYGSSVELNRKSEGELAALVIRGAKKRSCIIDKPNALYFISVVGSDIQTMLNELEKICSYVKSGEITRKIIDEIAVKSLQARIYDLSKFILKGNGEAAYKLLDALFYQKTEAIPILSVLSAYYVDMYRVKYAKQAAIPDNEIAAQFGYRGREFVIRNAARDSSQISVTALRESIDLLAESDEKLKSTSVNDRIIIEETVAKLLLLRNK